MTVNEKKVLGGGIILGAIVSVAIYFATRPAIPPNHNFECMILNSKQLAYAYNNGDYAKLDFSFLKSTNPGTPVLLFAQAELKNGGILSSPGMCASDPQIITLDRLDGNTIDPSLFNITKPIKDGQSSQIAELILMNPDGYFILQPGYYNSNNDSLYYQIIPFDRGGIKIPPDPSSPLPDRVFRLDPCPPAKPY